MVAGLSVSDGLAATRPTVPLKPPTGCTPMMYGALM